VRGAAGAAAVQDRIAGQIATVDRSPAGQATPVDTTLDTSDRVIDLGQPAPQRPQAGVVNVTQTIRAGDPGSRDVSQRAQKLGR
jgi:hypothetical protein